MQKRTILSTLCLTVIASALLLTANTGFAKSHKKHTSQPATPVVQPTATLASNPFIGEIISPKSLSGGAYIGASAGYDVYKARANFANASGAENSTYTPSGVLGNLFIGYGHYFYNFFYLGAEGFLNGTKANSAHAFNTSVPSTFYGTLNIKGSYGIALMPGFKVNDNSLLYVRLGYINSRFRSYETSNIGGTVSSFYTTVWQNGITTGLGLETAIHRYVSLRAEYDYARYSDFTTGAGTVFRKPSDNQATLSLLFHFA